MTLTQLFHDPDTILLRSFESHSCPIDVHRTDSLFSVSCFCPNLLGGPSHLVDQRFMICVLSFLRNFCPFPSHIYALSDHFMCRFLCNLFLTPQPTVSMVARSASGSFTQALSEQGASSAATQATNSAVSASDLHSAPPSRSAPATIIVKISGPVFFANCTRLRQLLVRAEGSVSVQGDKGTNSCMKEEQRGVAGVDGKQSSRETESKRGAEAAGVKQNREGAKPLARPADQSLRFLVLDLSGKSWCYLIWWMQFVLRVWYSSTVEK